MKERYKLIKDAGFDGLLMWWSNEFGRDKFGKNDYFNSPKLARESGLFIENIHCPLENQNELWNNNLAGEKSIETYLKCIDDCVSFEIPTMVIHLPNDKNPITSLDLHRIKKMTEKAEKYSINIAFENLNNINHLLYIFDQINSPNIGFCYDSGHHYSYCPDLDLLKKYGSRLMALHLHDNNGTHAQHGLPFDGEINWQRLMKKISKIIKKNTIKFLISIPIKYPCPSYPPVVK